MAKYYGDIAKSAKGAWKIDDDGGGGETRGREETTRPKRPCRRTKRSSLITIGGVSDVLGF